MAQPPGYTPATDFSDEELNNVSGRSTVRTAQLDAELAAVETTLDAVLVNLALNQRDDGEIRDGRVKLHTLSSSVLALFAATAGTPRGAWVTATAYALRDVVIQNTNTYICCVAHTSGTFATDLAAVRWILIALGTAITATGVPFTPGATIAATNVQTAIDEADTENRALSLAASTAVSTLQANLLSTASASVGAAMLGYDPSKTYLAGLGLFLNYRFARTAGEVLAGVTPTNYAYEPGDIRRYGGAPGAADNTTAMNSAAAALNASGGGVITIPTTGEWRMNFVLQYPNIVIQGVGGRSDFDLYCIRPFSLTSPPITVGTGLADMYYCGLRDLNISGSDGTTNGVTKAANNAPQALLLKGGTRKFLALNCRFYNGIQTVAEVPSATFPVTENIFFGCAARNDITNSASTRLIYALRLASPGYYTDNKHIRFKGNMAPGNLGYALEADGTAVGFPFEITDSYWDIQPALGVLLKGASTSLRCSNFQLDPGTTNVVVIETDQATTNVPRLIEGMFPNDGQRMKSTLGTYAIPTGVAQYAFSPMWQSCYFIGPMKWTGTADPFDAAGTAPRQDVATATGPLLTYNGVGTGSQTENGGRWTRGQVSELIVLATGATTTDSANSNLLPTDSIIEAVVARVTTTITTAANWRLGDATIAGRFSAASTGLTAGSTVVGTVHADQTGTSGPRQTANAKLRITCNANPGAGAIRVTVFYRQFIAPTS